MQGQFPPRGRPAPQQGAGRPQAPPPKRLQHLKYKLQHARRCNRSLETKLSALQVGKDIHQGGRMTPAFLAKVSLSWPNTCARNFASSWRDLVGVGIAGCSRPMISKIRDAFVEVAKDMWSRECIMAINAASAVSLRSRIGLLSARVGSLCARTDLRSCLAHSRRGIASSPACSRHRCLSASPRSEQQGAAARHALRIPVVPQIHVFF